MAKNVRLLCKLGIHQWFTDGAMFSSVRRCNLCPAVDNERDAAELCRERGLWEQYGDLDAEAQWAAVAKGFATGEVPREGAGWTSR